MTTETFCELSPPEEDILSEPRVLDLFEAARLNSHNSMEQNHAYVHMYETNAPRYSTESARATLHTPGARIYTNVVERRSARYFGLSAHAAGSDEAGVRHPLFISGTFTAFKMKC